MTSDREFKRISEVAEELGRSQHTIYNWINWGLLERDEKGLVSVEEAKKVRAFVKYNRTYGRQQKKFPHLSRRGKEQIPNHFLQQIKKTINP